LTGQVLRRFSWRPISPLVFLSLSSLNIFLFVCFVLRETRLPLIVLLSPSLDWVVWVASGSAFAVVSLLVARTHIRWMAYLGVVAIAGSVTEILSAVLKTEPVQWTGGFGGILMSCALIASVAISLWNSRKVFSMTSTSTTRTFLAFLFAIVLPLQMWWTISASSVSTFPRTYPRLSVDIYFTKLWQVLVPATVSLFVLLVTEWIWLPIASKVVTLRRQSQATVRSTLIDAGGWVLHWRLLLGLSLILGLLVSGYRWGRGYPLGDDSRYYAFVLQRMDSRGVQIAFATDRPVFFLGLYAVNRILGLGNQALLQLLPIFLALILIPVTYRFSKRITESEGVAAIAALFAAVSPHITVGAEYFIVANWLGLVLMMLFFQTFLDSIAKRSASSAALAIILSGITLGIHYFTWLFMMLVLSVYSLLSLAQSRSEFRRNMKFFMGTFLGCVSIAILAFVGACYLGGGALESLELVRHMIGLFVSQATPSHFINFLLDADRVQNYFGKEHYAIPLLFFLAITGFVRLRSTRVENRRLLLSWFVASCFGILIVYYNEWWRFLYMIPLEILAALGLTSLLQYAGLEQAGSPSIGIAHVYSATARLMIFLSLAVLLAFAPLPSLIVLFSLPATALMELLLPSSRHELLLFSLITLMLEQLARALSVLA